MAEYPFRFAGAAIGELSEKIPTNIIALNELIKNSYDAGANQVDINLDTNKRKLVISDDGSGMDDQDIYTLLQISKSTKQYGKLINGRYVQGSKGLGFLSVFKFGDKVTWRTVKDKEKIFTIDYSMIKDMEDISEYKVNVQESLLHLERKGTIIDIDLKDCYGNMLLKEYLLKSVNRDKILNSFIDNSFKISLIIDGQKFETKKIDLNDYFYDRRLFQVTYNSRDCELILKYMNHPKFGLTLNKVHKIKYNYVNSDRYYLQLNLMLYDLTSNSKKNRPDDLFIEPITPGEKLTPLIYVNKNLFNNFDLFDPEATRYFKTTDVIPQIIGYVELISDDIEIQYNADRTQFMQNELTDSIKNTLAEINQLIQRTGSTIKRNIKQQNEGHGGPNNEKKDTGGHDTQGKRDDENKDGGEADRGTSSSKAILLLKQSEVSVSILNELLVLSQYIDKVEDYRGCPVDHNVITYENSGLPIENGIIKLLVPFEGNISFIYNDPVEGKIVKLLKVKITNEFPLGTQKAKKVLIPNIAKAGYTINFDQTPINGLVNQLNQLYQNTRTSYKEVIACCLRALFELAIYKLEISGKIEFKFTKASDDRLLDKVTHLMRNICGNKAVLGEITVGLGLPSFQDFYTVLSTTDFGRTIKKCHLGAHKSSNSLQEGDFEEIGRNASIFLVIINELLNNAKINLHSLGHPWKIAI